MSRARRSTASRLAAVGAALSLAAGAAVAALATDRPAAPPGPANPATPVSPGTHAAKAPAKPPARTPADAAAEAAVDDELIEFLGSVGDGGEDGDWLDFLTSTDIDKVAKRGSRAPRGGQ